MRSRISAECGFTIPMLAVSIVALIAMGALAIDVGLLYTARTSAQHAADAAALAGAFTFVNNPGASAVDVSAAATSTATKNSILGIPVAVGEVQVLSVQLPTPTQPGRITLTVSRNIPTAFARAVGFDKEAIKVTATAEASNLAAGTTCLRPFWLRNSITGSCSNPMFWADGTPNQAVVNQMESSPWEFLQLHAYSPSQDSNSQWGLISEGNNPSGAAINAAIDSCMNVKTLCGDTVNLAPGNKFSIKNSIDKLLAASDTWVGPGVYQASNGAYTDVSPQVITIGIVDDCFNNATQLALSNITGNNNPPAAVAGFGEVFLTGTQGGGNNLTINSYLVNYNSCGNGGSGGGGGGGSGVGSGPYAIPVRLVQNP